VTNKKNGDSTYGQGESENRCRVDSYNKELGVGTPQGNPWHRGFPNIQLNSPKMSKHEYEKNWAVLKRGKESEGEAQEQS